MSQKRASATKKGNSILGCIWKSIASRSSKVILPYFLGKTHVECWVQCWSPQVKEKQRLNTLKYFIEEPQRWLREWSICHMGRCWAKNLHLHVRCFFSVWLNTGCRCCGIFSFENIQKLAVQHPEQPFLVHQH